MIKLLIITHGTMGKALLDTALMISGADSTGVEAIAPELKTDPKEFFLGLKERLNNETDGTIILADLFGGSGSNAVAMLLGRDVNGVLITGVNLNMVLAFLHNRDKMPLRALAFKIEESGKKGIINVNHFMHIIDEVEGR